MAEILAPAGNYEMLKAAVVNGADAVYLGMSKFSARAKAENFNNSLLKDAVDYAHLYGVKVFVAINTIIKDSEMLEALSEVKEALNSNVDALIVQDLGLVQLIRELYPQAVLHASTQLGIHNAEGAKVAKKLGFSRVILSRETLLSDIIKIKKEVDIEVEVFVHGALCIAFSGNCYFSSMASGYSGNRGKCMQLCRKKYRAFNGSVYKDGYLLSAKDMMLAGHIKKLIEAGVDCFKIEGRMRRSEYVAESVSVYKKAIKGYFSHKDLEALKKVYNRGDYTESHLFNGTNKILDTLICSHKGLYYCKVVSVNGKVAVLEKSLKKGDGLKFIRNGREVGGALVSKDGNVTGFDGNVAKGDDVYITTDFEFNKSILNRQRKLPVNIEVDFDKHDIIATYGDMAVKREIIGEDAVNRAVRSEDIFKVFDKSEFFEVENVSITGRDIFIVKSQLNEIRRKIYEELRLKIIDKYNKNISKFSGDSLIMSDIISDGLSKILKNRNIYQVESHEQITSDMDFISVNPKEYSKTELRKFQRFYGKCLLNLPPIARGDDVKVLKEIVNDLPFLGFIVNNLYALEIIGDKPCMLGPGMNIVNDVLSVPKIYSVESDTILNNGFIYAQGNIPLMHFCHCENKELFSGCSSCNGYDITLEYEGRKFPMRHYKIFYCYGQLLNCATLDVKSLCKGNNMFIDYSYKRSEDVTKGNYVRGLK